MTQTNSSIEINDLSLSSIATSIWEGDIWLQYFEFNQFSDLINTGSTVLNTILNTGSIKYNSTF